MLDDHEFCAISCRLDSECGGSGHGHIAIVVRCGLPYVLKVKHGNMLTFLYANCQRNFLLVFAPTMKYNNCVLSPKGA